MPGYAAFLRAINLGPNRRVSNAELRALFEQMGLREVSPFRSSGNVVFEAGRERTDVLAGRIERGLEESLGYEVGVFLRTASEVSAMAAHEPFEPDRVDASKGKLQVMLLSSKPAAATRRTVLALATEDDALAFGDRELYWLPSGGTLESQLDRGAL